ncbi:UDP-glucose 4-epimerase GalE [Candidatus Saccharibacteria bacterium 32-50-13]|nr:MAG: UDP-glucose 4-epimerase GalE [Candidatus Saccharibacteria bacterium 32-50-13]
MNILVTGGAGYIGSHTIIELQNAGHVVTTVDNLSNSNQEALRRVEKITGKPIEFHQFAVQNRAKLEDLFSSHAFNAVIHFAGLKSVGESVAEPLQYYQNNIDSTLSLLDAMNRHGVKKFLFSSSATVYGTPEELPLKETSRVGIGITNPYGQTKYMIEQILKDTCVADESFECTLLRYFNPVGADPSGTIGEDPSDTPNNLLPYAAQVAVGKLKEVKVFGNDYDTVDGTGVRDYIHVVDLAKGHVAALNHTSQGANAYNLCTGKGTSVLELINAFSKAADREIPYVITDRRPGDVASCYASPAKANRELGWYAERTIEQACADSWRWQKGNPNGYN